MKKSILSHTYCRRIHKISDRRFNENSAIIEEEEEEEERIICMVK